jgi:phage-related protein
MTKPLYFAGSALEDLRAFPPAQRREAGYRLIYVAKLDDAVYVLHAFRKKTQKTRKQDIEIARRRFREMRKT